MTTMSSEPRCELDSHADTCVFGKYCRVLQTYSHTLDVTGFHSSMNTPKNVHIACVCVAYDCMTTMNSFILVFDQCLYIPSLDVNLICVDQLRDHGLRVNDIPLIRLGAEERTNHIQSCAKKQNCIYHSSSINLSVISNAGFLHPTKSKMTHTLPLYI